MNEENEEIFSFLKESLFGEGKKCKEIDEGNFGIVYKTKLKTKKNKSNYLAVKKIIGNQSEIQNFEDLKKLEHENIIKYYDCNVDKKIFSMEFCDLDLLNFLRFQKETLKNQFDEMVVSILSGLNYLQEQQILHNDIKIENIMVKFNDKYKVIFKIADFGGIQKFGENYEYRGSFGYISPKKIGYLLNADTKIEIKDNESDIWSAGIVFFNIYMSCFCNEGIKYFNKLCEEQEKIRNIGYNKKEVLKYILYISYRAEKMIGFFEEKIESEKYRNLLENTLECDLEKRIIKTTKKYTEQDKNEEKFGEEYLKQAESKELKEYFEKSRSETVKECLEKFKSKTAEECLEQFKKEECLEQFKEYTKSKKSCIIL